MSNELTTLQSGNLQEIVSSAPTAYEANRTSLQRCTQFGQDILDEIMNSGMTDELDQRAAKYIERARMTITKMNERRSPLTKMFDEIRKQFTTMEGEVDPTKAQSIPWQIQQYRNKYAAYKKQLEDEKRRQQILEQQKAAEIARFRTDVEGHYTKIYIDKLKTAISSINNYVANLTLSNFDFYEKRINEYPHELTADIFSSHDREPAAPSSISLAESIAIRQEIIDRVVPGFITSYSDEVVNAKMEASMLLPSKKVELERAERASAEERERIMQDMKKREELEAIRKQQELEDKQKKEAAAAQLAQQQAAMGDLFNQASASVDQYQPKTSVKKKIVILHPDAFMQIIGMWWQNEGSEMSIEDLSKMFKRQITFCEKLANDKNSPELIKDINIIYEDEVKAK